MLARDPWLMSQTLMQIFYLLPPALLLWSSYHIVTNVYILSVLMVVMAAGLLGGGLAWLSISGLASVRRTLSRRLQTRAMSHPTPGPASVEVEYVACARI